MLENQTNQILIEGNNSEPNGSELLKKSVKHKKMLRILLSGIKPIDLIKEAELKDDEKLESKHILIIVVQKVLEIARKNDWDMCLYNGLIYVYNGEFWQPLEREEIQWFLGCAAEKFGVDKFTARHYQFKKQLFLQFISQAYLPKPERAKDLALITLTNGTYEISNIGSRLKPHDKADFITFQLPFPFNEEAKAILFMKYLDRVLPDKKCQYILAEFLGYVFISVKHLKLEKILLLYGDGANGKSVFYDIIRALLGNEYVSSYSLESLSKSEYYRAMLGDKLVNYGSEMSINLNPEILKKLSSIEPLEARHPYGQPFILEEYAKLIFNCNILPKETEQTFGFFRRFMIIPFTITIPESEQDKQLAQKIINNELSGVFNWVVEGLNRLLSQKGFTQSDLVNDELVKYKAESDNVKMFIEDNGYIKSPDRMLAAKFLSNHYTEYCKEYRYRALNHTNFVKRLRALGFEMKTERNGLIVYVEVKPDPGETTPKIEPIPVDSFENLFYSDAKI